MKKLMMQKCTKCNRIKHFDKWVFLADIEPFEVRRQLSMLIANDGVEWQFITCRDCLKA